MVIALYNDKPELVEQHKLAFAKALIANPDPMIAAAEAFPNEPAIMALACSQWLNDAIVQKAINDHFDALPPSSRSPGLDAIATEVLTLARKATATDDKLKSYRLWAELKGFITKGGSVNINNDNRHLTNANLFVVPAQPETPQEEKLLELRAMSHQARLAGNAS